MSVQVIKGSQQDMQDRRNNNPKGSEESIKFKGPQQGQN